MPRFDKAREVDVKCYEISVNFEDQVDITINSNLVTIILYACGDCTDSTTARI